MLIRKTIVDSFPDKCNVIPVSNDTVGSILFVQIFSLFTILSKNKPSHRVVHLNNFRFFFTELDPVDPSRKFSFVLDINDEEKYDIVDCDPNIDVKTLVDILEELNGTDRADMSMLVRRMRKFLHFVFFFLSKKKFITNRVSFRSCELNRFFVFYFFETTRPSI